MRSSRPSLRRVALLSAVVTLSMLSATALAQGNNNNNPAPSPSPSGNSPSPASSNGPSSAASSAASSAPPPPRPTSAAAPSSSGAPPRLSNDMPVATRTQDQIPTYPAASVPPTYHAPFMRHSTLPEGTIFICVGAILGAFGLGVLLWRGIVACLLHRSVERAALAQHAANDKASFPPPPAPFYKTEGRDSSPHLAGAVGRGQRRTTRGPIPSATPSQTNLFFSPTAGNANNNAMGGTAANRDSRFLPSGFYAAGTSSPANGHGHSISLSNLRPDSRGYSRAMGTTPPESPALGPRTTPQPMPRAQNMSTSSVNLAVLNRPSSSRAPSAYLDDLLDEQPHLFPPGGPPPAHQNRNSSASGFDRRL